jgi:hypothetical protein
MHFALFSEASEASVQCSFCYNYVVSVFKLKK